MNSFIATAAIPPEDGLLRVSEVFELDFNAALVILGACQTGGGQASGDGMIGLSRAFTYAGASTLVVTLWSALETVSLTQMYRFHHWLKEGLPKARALRKAQLEHLGKDRDNPKHWAIFAMYGDHR